MDLQKSCYSARTLHPGLVSTYRKRLNLPTKFPNTPEGRNRSGIAMTFRLWQLWKTGAL